MAIKSQTQRALLKGFIASIATCGAVGIYCLLDGSFRGFHGRVLATTAVVAVTSILGLASAIPWERRRWPPVGLLGLIAVLSALVLLVFSIWGEFWIPPSEWWADFYRVAGTVWVLAIAFPHIGLISLARLHRKYEWIRVGTVVGIIILAAQTISSILDLMPSSDLSIRLMGVVAIAVACGTIAVPILHRVSVIGKREAVRTVELFITAICPRCNTSQQLLAGRSNCNKCGLRFSIEIEEESCQGCGYPLYQLTSAACPECGTPILQT